MLLIAMRRFTLSEKSNPLDTVFFPDKRYASNEPNSNDTSLVG